MLLRDEKAAGTGGNAVIGTQTRILNTVVVNTIPGASLAGNVITLPAGDYDVDAYAPTGTSAHRSHLYNVTDAAVAILGTSENSTTTGTNDLTITGSIVRGRISIAGAKNFELRTWCSENRTNGFGAPVSDGAGAEVFAVVSIRKVK